MTANVISFPSAFKAATFAFNSSDRPTLSAAFLYLSAATVVAVSKDFYRPTDVVNLWGDPSKARHELGWNPQKTTFEELVEIMVKHDIAKVKADAAAAQVRVNLAEYLEKGIVK